MDTLGKFSTINNCFRYFLNKLWRFNIIPIEKKLTRGLTYFDQQFIFTQVLVSVFYLNCFSWATGLVCAMDDYQVLNEQAEYHVTMGAAYLILYEVFFGQLTFSCIVITKCAEAVLGLR